ncbi:MAG: hypothetical protein U0T68_00335 [Ferruginibacter sp.]
MYTPGKNILNLNIMGWCLYVAFLLLVAIYSYHKPACNWDMLPYMAIVLQYDYSKKNIHDEVYRTAAEEIPAAYYMRLTDSSHICRFKAFNNKAFFNSQLPFYVVKPLYTFLVYCFYKLGIPLTKSTVIVSVIAWFVLSLMLLFWLRQSLEGIAPFLLSALTAASVPLLEAVGLSTPDALSALCMTAAVYGLLNKKNRMFIAVLFLLAMLTRLDNMLPVLVFITAFTFYKPIKQFSFYFMLVMVGLIAAVYCLVTYQSLSYGWSFWYYPDFINHLHDAVGEQRAFHFSSYFELMKSQLINGLKNSSVWVFLLLMVLHFCKQGKFHFDAGNEGHIMLVLFLLVIALRFLLQPVIADRFYIPYYIPALVIFVRGNRRTENEIMVNAISR